MHIMLGFLTGDYRFQSLLTFFLVFKSDGKYRYNDL